MVNAAANGFPWQSPDGSRVHRTLTLAPAATALRMRVWHCARLWLIDAVEHICPIACSTQLSRHLVQCQRTTYRKHHIER